MSSSTKKNWLIRVLLVLVISAPTAGRAYDTPASRDPIDLTERTDAQEPLLRHEIARSLQLERFSVQEVSIVEEASGRISTSVIVENKLYSLSLQRSVVRAPGFRVLVDDGAGMLREVTPSPSKTYRGMVDGSPGSVVAASFDDGQLTAVIRFGNGNIWAIQPITNAVPLAPRSWHVVFRDTDADVGQWACGTRNHRAVHGFGTSVEGDYSTAAGSTTVVIADLALDADFEFLQANGGSVDATVADIEFIVNGVNVIYENDVSVWHRITAVLVRQSDSDPYTMTDSNLLLDEFIAEWNTNQGAIFRDVAHLMTGKNLDQNIIGIAELQSVCVGDQAYGLSQSRFSSSMPARIALTAHELGHNWSAVHCDGETDCSIMCSVIGDCSGDITSFGATAITNITSYKGFLVLFMGCLDFRTAQLELVADSGCLQTGQTVTVTLWMSDLVGLEAAGYQAFFSFDQTHLSFVSGTYTNAPFGLHLIDPITAIGGTIDLAAEIDQAGGQGSTTADADLATLTFTAVAEDCVGTAVAFRSGPSPTEITDVGGIPASGLVTVYTSNIVIDGTAPNITCPADVTVIADVGGSTATIDPGTGLATDNCGAAPTITSSRSDGLLLTDPYPAGTTTITWGAADPCGNIQECTTAATVIRRGDFDANGGLDLVDHAMFQPCLGGPIDLAGAECAVGDFDDDGYVDLSDWAVFQAAFSD